MLIRKNNDLNTYTILGSTLNHPRLTVTTITGGDYIQQQKLNYNFRPSSSQINQNPLHNQFLNHRLPSPGLGKCKNLLIFILAYSFFNSL